jgi:translation initiation factor IF-2
MAALDEKTVASVRESCKKPAEKKAPAKPAHAPAAKAVVPQPAATAAPAVPAAKPKPAPATKPKADAEDKTAKKAPPKPAPPAAQPPPEQPAEPGSKVISIHGSIVVKDLAHSLGLRPNQVVADLMAMNVFASLNQSIDAKTARLVAEKHGFELEAERKIEEHRQIQKDRITQEEAVPDDRPEDMVLRAPVVTFMGHVDHGKTSLLDKIRHAHVADGESGGITQHIGAYTVELRGSRITFLDTPGHAAFTAMRARGAKLTDIVVIVIAAEDGIMPQTKEAISHAQAAEVAILAAINKIDLPGANVDKVKGQLQAMGLAPEDWGGSLICCPVSAQTGEGIDRLLEMILLQAEMMELKANPKRPATGFVVEARLEAGMGPTATLLVENGTLSVGDVVLCGACYGKVKALIDDKGKRVLSTIPGLAVRCLGLSAVPEAGDSFRVCANERTARDQAEIVAQEQRAQQAAGPLKASLETLFAHLKDSEKKELRVVLKADTQGSIEAIAHSLEEIKSDKVSLHFILKGTGNVTANDVMLASASEAVILAFYVSKEPNVDSLAKREGVEIRLHHIIYELIDEVRDAMIGLLTPRFEERMLGRAEIKQVFPLGKRGKIAGCLALQGQITPKLRVRVKRKDEVLHEGSIASLRRFQNDVSIVKETQEFGIRLEGFADFAEGDALEFYELEEIKQTL